MPDTTNAGEAPTSGAADQNSAQISTANSSDQTTKASEVKTEEAGEKSENAKKEESVKEDPTSDKPEPFHKHPAWQRQIRKNARLSTQLQESNKRNADLAHLIRESIAAQKGEEYKPEASSKDETSSFDPEVVLDDEMEEFSLKANLSIEEENAVMDIARKYGQDLGDGKKVYLPIKTAYAIYKDGKGGQGESVKDAPKVDSSTVSTKPTNSNVNENKVGDAATRDKQAATMQEARLRARMRANRELP